MDDAGDRQTVFDFYVAHGMSSGDHAAGLLHFLSASAQDLTQHFQLELVVWKTDNIQSGLGKSTALGVTMLEFRFYADGDHQLAKSAFARLERLVADDPQGAVRLARDDSAKAGAYRDPFGAEVVVALVSAGGAAVGAIVTGLLGVIRDRGAQRLHLKKGDLSIDLPRDATTEDIDRLIDVLRRLDGQTVDVRLEQQASDDTRLGE